MSTGTNGKGSAPRNCFSGNYRSNYDRIFRRDDGWEVIIRKDIEEAGGVDAYINRLERSDTSKSVMVKYIRKLCTKSK